VGFVLFVWLQLKEKKRKRKRKEYSGIFGSDWIGFLWAVFTLQYEAQSINKIHYIRSLFFNRWDLGIYIYIRACWK
jgi:hypothetical protein